jgi:hypothetical protein
MQIKWWALVILEKAKSISNIHWNMYHVHAFNHAFAYKLSYPL